MSSLILRDKVAAFLSANWSKTVIAGLENEIDSPPDNLDPWLSYSFQPFSESVVAIGSPSAQCLRETGLLQLNCWIASGRGSAEALGYAEDLRTLFRNTSLGDGVRFTTVSPPSPGIPSQAKSSSGNWFAYQVEASYIYNYQA